MTKIAHVVGLSGIGGVQRQFSEYLKYAQQYNDYEHEIYTVGSVDDEYNDFVPKIFNLLNVLNLLRLACRVIDNKSIVHFYNKFGSISVCILLLILPSRKIIVHERGIAWNIPKNKNRCVRIIAKKASVILANSNASKYMLVNKFNINENKIIVLRNGLINSYGESKKKKLKEEIFKVGFVGRLEAFKGVHTLIYAAELMNNNKISFVIAGDGPLLEPMKKLVKAQSVDNVHFLGRIKDPNKFISSLDLLVVPSIREPLGNVCIEAGICRVPVLASYVDGIPEIIEHNVSGELIIPTKALSAIPFDGFAKLLPEYVIDPGNMQLRKPLEIDPEELANRIIYLRNNPKRCQAYTAALSKSVRKFSIENYLNNLHKIYNRLEVDAN